MGWQMRRSVLWAVGLVWALAGCGDGSDASSPADCVALNQMMIMCGRVDADDDNFGRICQGAPTGSWVLGFEACRIEADGQCSAFNPCAERATEQ